MAWFNRGNGSQNYDSKGSPSMPLDRNCEDSDYEKYIWMAYVDCSSGRWKETVKWERLEYEFYKATLENGDIIFFIANDNRLRHLQASETKFDTEKQWVREFARRLNYIMDRKSLNQIMLSEKTGISQASISSYLNCKKIPSAYTLVTLASALGTTVDFLSKFP